MTPILHHSQKLTQMDQTFRYKTQFHKTSGRKHRQNFSTLILAMLFSLGHPKHKQEQRSINGTTSYRLQEEYGSVWAQGGFSGGPSGKEPVCQCWRQIQIQSLGQEDPLEEDVATYSSLLAWRIPWTEEPGRLQSEGLQRVDTAEWPSTAHMQLYNMRFSQLPSSKFRSKGSLGLSAGPACPNEKKFFQVSFLVTSNLPVLPSTAAGNPVACCHGFSEILWLHRNGTPLQYSCLENPMDGGTW